MLKSLRVTRDFAAVPYLESSALMQRHGGRIEFSITKPNVIIGPNGAGKSALLGAIALRFLAHLYHQSWLNPSYVRSFGDEAAWWSGIGGWRHEYTWLPGLECDTDQAPILYYRPGHIPGNEDSVVTAMMVGYRDQAKAYAQATRDKSSGQKSQALLQRMIQAIEGDAQALPIEYLKKGWHYGLDPIDRDAIRQNPMSSESDYMAEELKKAVSHSEDAMPMIVMDEPEQSLDAMAEVRLWNSIESARERGVKAQIVVATHSLYPILHPQEFHIIEAVDGYAEEARLMLS